MHLARERVYLPHKEGEREKRRGKRSSRVAHRRYHRGKTRRDATRRSLIANCRLHTGVPVHEIFKIPDTYRPDTSPRILYARSTNSTFSSLSRLVVTSGDIDTAARDGRTETFLTMVTVRIRKQEDEGGKGRKREGGIVYYNPREANPLARRMRVSNGFGRFR